MSELISSAAAENANFFKNDSTPAGRALYCGFQRLASQCRNVTPLLERVKKEAPKFDLDVETPGNGMFSTLLYILKLI